MQIERNYLRRSYRINLPAYVTINDKTYNTLDWSFLGFRIKSSENFEKNREYEIFFELPFAGFDMRFKTKAVCRWNFKGEAGFEFTELSDEIKLVMKEYVEAYIEGRLQNTSGILKAAEGIELPVDTSTSLNLEEKKKLNKSLFKNLLLYFVLFIIVGFVIYKIYLNRNAIYSAEAFVSGNYYNIISPQSGIIEKIYITPGDKIKKSALIATIKNPEIAKKINELNTTYTLTQNKIKLLNSLLNELKQTKNPNLTQIKLLKKALKNRQKELKRYEKLFKMGLVDYKDVQNIKNDIENIKLKIASLKTTSPNNQLNGLKLSIINTKQALLNIKHQIDLLKKESETNITSPYSGTVLNVFKQPLSPVSKNTTITTINIDSSKTYVIGRFKYKDALNIYLDDKAQVYIPSLKKTYKGKVVAIGIGALNSNISPNDQTTYTRKDIPVKVEILNPDQKLIPGIAAQIKIAGE